MHCIPSPVVPDHFVGSILLMAVQPHLLMEERRAAMHAALKYRWHLVIVSSVSSTHISVLPTNLGAVVSLP